MTITASEAHRLALSLFDAHQSRTPISPISDALPGLSLADAYAIQTEFVSLLVNSGDQIGAFKLGLTSSAMQGMLGIDSPDFAPVMSSAIYADGAEIRVTDFIAPRVEAELALILSRPLAGPGVTPDDVRTATLGLLPAVEIVDSRIRDWKIALTDTVADLASNGAIAVGAEATPLTFDPRLVGMAFWCNGELVATGSGAAALGNPLAAVAWLANTLGDLGGEVPAGVPILTGALHAMVPITPGETYIAEFDRIGSITLTIG